jgi:predicted dehydrogenase
MGRRHAENVRRTPGCRLIVIGDLRGDVAARVAADLECPRWTANPEEAIALPDVQAVIIATSADTHAPLLEVAAAHGRDVLCEKPLALTLDEAQRGAEALRRAGRRLQVGFMRRYDPGYAAAQEAIQSGQVGTPLLFQAVSRDREPPSLAYLRSSGAGGVFVDSATTLIWLAGSCTTRWWKYRL